MLAPVLLCSTTRLTSAQEEPVTSHIPRERVESKMISAIGYSKRRHWLEPKFVNDGIYGYLEVAIGLPRSNGRPIKSQSHARYIRNNYHSLRIRTRVKDEAAR